MSYDQARQDIQTEIERARTAWTAYDLPIETENRDSVNLVDLTTPYIMVDILWGDAQQLDMNPNPLTADYGTILLAAGVKEGNGTRPLLELLEHFRPYLQMRHPLGTVRTHIAKIQDKPLRIKGYYYLLMQVPFWTVQAAPAVP